MIIRDRFAVIVAVLGAACMAALAFGLGPGGDGHPFIGARLYDIYARMLLEGRLDMPVRELNVEGHYTPDGRGYMYHGLGPLLTRLPLLPFVSFPTPWLAPFSIWLWAVIGNACCHRAFSLALGGAQVSRGLSAMIAIAIWFGSPGILLAANGSVYYEPIAMAYGLSGAFIMLIAMVSFGTIAIERALPWLAIIAGLSVHARPHVAVGLYAGVCLIALVVARRGGVRNWSLAGLAMLLLGLFGGLLLAFNAARFDSIGTMHGSFAKSELQYGLAYWGFEDPTQGRAKAFEEHGRLNPGRIPSNLAFYAAAPPRTEATRTAVAALQDFHLYFASAANVRIEQPITGFLLLWAPFILFMAAGLRQCATRRMPAIAGIGAVFVGALLMLSYATITARYLVDIWPAVALPAVFGIAPIAAKLSERSPSSSAFKLLLPLLMVVGLALSATLAFQSRSRLREEPGRIPQRWSHAYCIERTAMKGFSALKSRELCRVSFGAD